MSDEVIRITDPETYERERRADYASARRGYLSGIEDALYLARRTLDATYEYHKQEPIRELIAKLERVRYGEAAG